MVVSAATAFAQAPCASFGPAVTRLDGRLERAFAYGPPGYGESPRKNARETYLVIVLDKPLCTARGADETQTGHPSPHERAGVSERTRRAMRLFGQGMSWMADLIPRPSRGRP